MRPDLETMPDSLLDDLDDYGSADTTMGRALIAGLIGGMSAFVTYTRLVRDELLRSDSPAARGRGPAPIYPPIVQPRPKPVRPNRAAVAWWRRQ